MKPHHSDKWLTIYQGDCRKILEKLPAESVHSVITSPPYYGLRDYGTAVWTGGDQSPDHVHSGHIVRTTPAKHTRGKQLTNSGSIGVASGDCLCGAVRTDEQIGLEKRPEDYVASLVAVFREVRRVLRPDGTLWLVLGDSYAGSWGNYGGRNGFQRERVSEHWLRPGYERTGYAQLPPTRTALIAGLKPKDLIGIPWRVAFALQEDGWWLRSDIVWSKPNAMPESVQDRPTRSHEYVFLFAKSERYYYDAEAIREPSTERPSGNRERLANAERSRTNDHLGSSVPYEPAGNGRNARSVWTVATVPYPGSHYAVFPPKLIAPAIQASTSAAGVCRVCGDPWSRDVELVGGRTAGRTAGQLEKALALGIPRASYVTGRIGDVTADHVTRGWRRPACGHAGDPEPATVLDPFAGSGTVGAVAQFLSRRATLIDLNAAYLEQQLERTKGIPLGLMDAVEPETVPGQVSMEDLLIASHGMSPATFDLLRDPELGIDSAPGREPAPGE